MAAYPAHKVELIQAVLWIRRSIIPTQFILLSQLYTAQGQTQTMLPYQDSHVGLNTGSDKQCTRNMVNEDHRL